MRTQRNNITLDVDSALALMQEIYNDVVENRNTASQILRKMMGGSESRTRVDGGLQGGWSDIVLDYIKSKLEAD